MDYFSEKLDSLLSIHHMSKNRLANELDISESTIRSWYKGSVPALDKVIKIAKYFEVSIDFLAGCETSEQKKTRLVSDNYASPADYTTEEIELIKIYRSLSDGKKQALKTLFGITTNTDTKNHLSP